MSQSKSAVTTQADKRGEVELILLSTKLDGSGRTNVLEWLDKHGSVLGSKHGYAASVLFSTYKNYIVPPPDAIFQEEGMPNWSADQMKFLVVDAMKAFMKEKRELVVKLNMLYHDMWTWISLESRQRINGDSRAEAMHAKFDPQALMTLIRETHLTNVDGAVRDKDMEALTLQTEFLTLAQQPGTSISVHKKKFDDVYKSYLEAGGAKMSEEQVVIRFLSSLDGLRHRDMCINIENQRKLGTARPATLAIAYATASSWKSTTLAPGSVATDFNAVYLCTDDVPAVSVLIVPPAKQPRGKRVGKKTATMEASTVPSTSVNSETPTVAREDTRKCNYCHKTGHLWRNCPTHKVVMLTTPQGDEEEDADTYRVASQATFMITSAPSASESPCCILFTDTEVILDNAAGQSVFKNPALLHAIVSTPSVSLGGVN